MNLNLALSPRVLRRAAAALSLAFVATVPLSLSRAAEHASQTPAAPVTIDWPAFLSRQDLVWAANPTTWEEAAFIGNGNLGATIFVQDGALAWEVNRADVYHNRERYPMGRVALKTAGTITGGELRLDLWNAEARGTLHTERGDVRWRSFTATSPSVIAIELEGTGGESAVDVSWTPAEARSPRKVYQKSEFDPSDLHPPAVVEKTDAGVTSTQSFLNGGAFAVSLRRASATGTKKLFYIAIAGAAEPKPALAAAGAAADAAVALGLDRVVAAHRAWWHAFYPASFVSFPDARLEAFYWIQVYKLGAAMRGDGPILDLMGPWFRRTPWPRAWWNLNIQLTYHPLPAANRLALSESLFTNLDRNLPQLIKNVPEPLRATAAAIGRSADPSLASAIDLGKAPPNSAAGREAGNLPWVAFLYWEFARYQNDDAILRDRVMPLLSRAIGHYLGYVEKGEDGRYHIPPTHSPEFATVPDTNYDLAFLRWGLQTLIATTERLKLDKPQLARWHDVLANLTPPPVDDTGLMIGRGKSLDASHRHYSHLMAIYPLHLITPDQPTDRALIEKSLAHWLADPKAHRGYSNTGAASMFELLGRGDPALEQLHKLLDTWIKPNTLYTEAGPVIETPLSAMSSVHEMFLQSWGGKLRVFPAVPSSWKDASFATLRGEGGYLVTAARRDGHTAWLKIEYVGREPNSTPCRISVGDWTAVAVRGGTAKPGDVSAMQNGEFTVALPEKGSWVLLAPATDTALPPVASVALPAASQNPYPQRYK